MSRTTTDVPPGPAAPQRRGWPQRALHAIDERLGIDAIRYPVPAHANRVAYSLGGLTAFALGILIVTGVILAQFYNPDPTAANESVRHIVQAVWAGRFIRGVHFWAAEAMYVLAILHLLRIYFTGAYKRPREANWLIGVGMLALTIGAMFTGTVLKWDQEGFEALSHNLEIGKLLGGLGFWFNPDFSSGVPILIRLYIAHVSIIPMLILGLLGLLLLGALSLIAVLFPPGIGPTPVEGIEVTKPPWMYWWMFTLENWIGLSGIVWGAGVLFALLVAVPFIDRNPRRYWRRRPIALGLGALVLAFLIVLSILEAVTTPVEHLGGM